MMNIERSISATAIAACLAGVIVSFYHLVSYSSPVWSVGARIKAAIPVGIVFPQTVLGHPLVLAFTGAVVAATERDLRPTNIVGLPASGALLSQYSLFRLMFAVTLCATVMNTSVNAGIGAEKLFSAMGALDDGGILAAFCSCFCGFDSLLFVGAFLRACYAWLAGRSLKRFSADRTGSKLGSLRLTCVDTSKATVFSVVVFVIHKYFAAFLASVRSVILAMPSYVGTFATAIIRAGSRGARKIAGHVGVATCFTSLLYVGHLTSLIGLDLLSRASGDQGTGFVSELALLTQALQVL